MCQSKASGGKRCALHLPSTRAVLAALRTRHTLDRVQADAVFKKTRTRATGRSQDPTPEQWDQFITTQINRLALDLGVDQQTYDRVVRQLHATRNEIPDAQTYAAYQELDMRAQKAESAVRRQLHTTAAFRGTEPADVEERYTAFRHQYLTELSSLPANERPDPPPEWVTGFTTKDMMAVSAPNDRATLYAMYRCQADPEAFGTNTRKYASIDLETAGPSGKAGFLPENGSIIEVGIIEYDAEGNETDRYAQLVAPAPEVAQTCGTGVVEIHGITLDDVADAPAWTQVAPVVAARLNGRVLLAQNARFEGDWLNHHMGAEGHDFDRWGPTVDTMCIAKQHLPNLANHRLATICESVNVAYTDGHRALHDADVAGQAFFALRHQIVSTYLSSPARRAATQPAPGAGRKRNQASKMLRLSAKDFDPATVDDRWATAPPVSTSAA